MPGRRAAERSPTSSGSARRWPRCSSGAGYTDPAEARRVPRGRAARPRPVRARRHGARRSTRIRAAVAAGKRICVHGDYDADGICATALAVFLLRELGADPAWHLPSRFEEGYGLAAQTLAQARRRRRRARPHRRLRHHRRRRGRGGDAARARGRRHRPPPARRRRFPACPVVAPLKGDYPFAGLCGTAVVWKLAEALLGAGHPFLDRHLDIVALATVADVVPLVDESRALALAGLRRLVADAEARAAGADARRRRRSGGLRRGRDRLPARAADQRLRAGSAGPRRRSRCCSPTTPARPTRLAEQLEDLNRERQAVEERILRAAIAEIESWPEARRRRRGYVVAGEDWHEGVIGIVASRLVERFGRPVVLIAGTASGGDWKGSGRAGGTFDLHGALTACAEHLERFGGHRAAAGLSIRPEHVEAFAARVRRARRRRARPTTTSARGSPSTRSSAAPSSGFRSARSSRGSRRSGSATPGVTLLVDDCELDRPRHGRRRQASSLPRPPARPRRRLGDRVRLRRADRPLPPDRPLRRRLPAAGEPLERHRLAAARRPPDLRHRRALRGAPRLVRRAVAARRAAPGRPRCAPCSTSSASPAGEHRRSLLESETFRRLLEEPPPLARGGLVAAERSSASSRRAARRSLRASAAAAEHGSAGFTAPGRFSCLAAREREGSRATPG